MGTKQFRLAAADLLLNFFFPPPIFQLLPPCAPMDLLATGQDSPGPCIHGAPRFVGQAVLNTDHAKRNLPRFYNDFLVFKTEKNLVI